jgi:hypothetical protein
MINKLLKISTIFKNKFNYNSKIISKQSIIIFIFIAPIVFYGIKDLEEYQLGYFTLKNYIKYPSTFFNGYIDFYGAGSALPIGHFPFLHPANILLYNTQAHYFSFLFINLITQIYFLKRINKLLNVEYNILNIIICIFSVSNFNYIYSDDWPAAGFIYSLTFPIIYYLIKFINKNERNTLCKLTIWLAYQFINGHIGSLFNTYFFIFFFLILNFNKKIFRHKYLYICLLIYFLIILESLYFNFIQFYSFPDDIPSQGQSEYRIKHYIGSFINPFYFESNRLPSYGILLLLCGFFFIKKNFIESKKIFFLNYIFLIFFILSITPFLKKIGAISAVWQFRDILNILAIVFVNEAVKKISFKKVRILANPKKIRILIIFLLLIFVIKSYEFNLKKNIDYSKNNFIANVVNHDNLITSLNKFKLQKGTEDYYRFYISPEVYNQLRNKMKDYGVYAITDLINYKVYPFNGWFKNFSTDEFNKDFRKMHGEITSNYKDINNIFFLRSYLIKYILINESELNKINIDYKIIDTIVIEESRFYIVKIIENNLPVLKENKNIKDKCSSQDFIFCKLNKDNFVFKNNIYVHKSGLNKLLIINERDEDVTIVFPFYKSNNWTANEKINFNNFHKNFKTITIKKNSTIEFEYSDNIRSFLKIISLLSIIILFFLIIINKNSKNINPKIS